MKLKILFSVVVLLIISCQKKQHENKNSNEKDHRKEIILKKSIETSNPKANEYYLNGLDEIENQNYEEGKKLFLKAAQLAPENSTILNCIANVEFILKNNKKAEEIYFHTIKIDKNNPQTYINLSRLYLSEGRFLESEKILVEVENLIENETIETKFAFYANLTMTYGGLKDFDKAIETINICKNYTFSKETEQFTEATENHLNSLIK
jgi:tetratricopeptide (TPR) repeat protein